MKKIDFKKLKSLREGKNITQEQMGKKLNTTQSNYNKLEKGVKKINNLDTIESLANALGMRTEKLLSVLAGNDQQKYVGLPEDELVSVDGLLKDNPIREDEFIILSCEVINLERFDFKEYYSGINLNELDEDDPFPIGYPETIHVITSPVLEVGFQKINNENLCTFWLGDKKLGSAPGHLTNLLNELMDDLRISRVVLIENKDSVSGFFNTYMKAVLIGTNAIAKSIAFNGHSFSPIKLLTPEEAERMDREADEEE